MSENIQVVKIPQRATIENAESIKKDLLDAFKSNSKVHLMISDIKTCDLSFIQLFISAKKFALKNEKEVHLTGEVSAALMKSFSITGITSMDFSKGRELEAAIDASIEGVLHA